MNTDLKEMRERYMLTSTGRGYGKCKGPEVRTAWCVPGEKGESREGQERRLGAGRKGPCLGLQGLQPLLCWRGASAGC